MARAFLIGAFTTYLLAVFQTTLGGRIALWGVPPDLLLLWTICVGLQNGPEAGALAGFGSGVLQGSLGQSLIGALGLSKTVSGFISGRLSGQVSREHWFTPVACAVVITLVNEILFLLLSGSGGLRQAVHVIGVRLLYHALLAPFMYAAVVRGRRALLPARVRGV